MATASPVELPGEPAPVALPEFGVAGLAARTAAGAALALLAYAIALTLGGQLGAALDPGAHALVSAQLRHATVISLLIGFTWAAWQRERGLLRRDLAALAPLLPPGESPPSPEKSPELRSPLRHVAAAVGAALGIVVVFATIDDVPAMLGVPFGLSHLLWSLGANALLFGLMARMAFSGHATARFLQRGVTSRLEVPLLDPRPLAPYVRRGLRACVYWFVGSSIASLLFANWGFSWTMVVILTCTLGLGSFALLEPSRQLRGRVRAAKQVELARVRDAIEAARSALLDARDPQAAARLPGLLAWEARVEAVPEWPIDVATWLRFSALALLAAGSWLGGALMEQIVGLVLR